MFLRKRKWNNNENAAIRVCCSFSQRKVHPFYVWFSASTIIAHLSIFQRSYIRATKRKLAVLRIICLFSLSINIRTLLIKQSIRLLNFILLKVDDQKKLGKQFFSREIVIWSWRIWLNLRMKKQVDWKWVFV